jgi:alpha-tubulin suppressor-like RCC1 family protein
MNMKNARGLPAVIASLVILGACASAARAGELRDVVEIAANQNNTCALTSAGGVKCWGEGVTGGLGDGTVTTRADPRFVTGLATGVAAISGSCALTSGGAVKCWGSGPVDGASHLTPVDMPGLGSGVAAISATFGRGCAVTTSGAAKCWGNNDLGALGDGTDVPRTAPVDVVGLASGIAAISTGIGAHSCAITTSGGVKCWGSNEEGQLGDGTTTSSSTPVDVAGLAGVMAIAVGYNFTCAVVSGGAVKCWGGNEFDALGTGSPSFLLQRSLSPVDVLGLSSGVTSIDANTHVCAVQAGSVKCWGSDEHGQLGDEGFHVSSALPVGVSGLAVAATSVKVGDEHSCALTTSGGVMCWGDNFLSELGAPGFPSGTVAVEEPGLAQTLAFGPLAAHEIGDAPFGVSAAASSGMAVEFTSQTSAVCTIAGTTVTLVAPGICSLLADQPGDSVYASARNLQSFVISAPGTTAIPRLASISTRMPVMTGDDVAIVGFIIGGSTPKTVIVNARGPSLAAQGVAGTLADPTLQLVPTAGGNVVVNNDWPLTPGAATIQSLNLSPADSHESSIMATLSPGAYTAIVRGVNDATGVGIVEVIEVDHPELPLVGISTRGEVLTGDDVMIGGFIIQGTAPQTVIVRARGPSLAAAGIADVLADPQLQLVRSSDQAVIATNDNWRDDPSAGEISTRGFAPGDARESAMLVTVPPGAYPAIVSGVGGATGVGIVEVFAQ